MAEMQNDAEPVFLSRAATRRWDWRAASVFGAISLLVCLVTIPVAAKPAPMIAAFIPAYEAAVIVTALITAMLLLGEFVEQRGPALLVLGGGYLFNAAIVIAHLISFPGLVGPGPLIGGGQTTVWLYVLWHTIFPLAVIGYAVLARAPPVPTQHAARLAWSGMLAALAVAVSCAVATTWGHHLLPVLMDGNLYRSDASRLVLGCSLAAPLAALVILLALTRASTVLDLWLAVVLVAWTLDILLSAVLNTGRFQVGFYVGRIYGLLAATFMLAVLLMETIRLHNRLARALAATRAHAAELRWSEAALREAQKMEVVGRLTGGVAHDFNNLLTGIIGSLESLEGEVGSERARRLLATAQRAAARGSRVTSQLLAFSRRQRLVPEPVDLNAMITSMEVLLRSTLGGTIRIETVLQPDLVPALADRAQLELVLLNLAINARDAMPAGGVMAIETTLVRCGTPARPEEPPPGEYVCLAVADTGHGMAPHVLESAFEPFFTTREIGQGSGLGLPQVLGVAKQLGGGVQVTTTVGKGTTLRVFLPRAPADTALAKPAAVASVKTLEGAAVLLVDDDPDVREAARDMLEELGCDVTESADGPAALDTLAAGVAVDVAMLDFAMPGMNGAELARAIHRQRPALPIVLATGYAEFSTAGAEDAIRTVMTKPYRRADLLAHLGPVIGPSPPTHR